MYSVYICAYTCISYMELWLLGDLFLSYDLVHHVGFMHFVFSEQNVNCEIQMVEKPWSRPSSLNQNPCLSLQNFHQHAGKKMSNQSTVTGFLLWGFFDTRELQIFHFMVLLGVFLAAVVGNLIIIVVIAVSNHLHTPMCFFLMNLSTLDLSTISVTLPKSMVNFLLNTTAISYPGCPAQIFFFHVFGAADLALLTVVAYDYMQTSLLPDNHEGHYLHPHGSQFLAQLHPTLCSPHWEHLSFILLQVQHDWPVLLWSSTASQAFLLWFII